LYVNPESSGILTSEFVNYRLIAMLDVAVIDEPSSAVAVLDPVRSAIVRELADPGSATTVAASLGLARQKVNYHLRALEAHGLVALVEERPRRGLTERILQATARSYVVSARALGPLAPAPEGVDRWSARYLVALASRLVCEVGDLARRADAAGKSLPTLAIDTDIRFASAKARAEFTAALASCVTELTARYHDEQAAGGRWHRVVVAAHPHPSSPSATPHQQGASS
jgi:DNA-binding transcriptional ArsR family regulator